MNLPGGTRTRTKLLVLGLMSLAIVSMTAGSMMSMALFTDTQTDSSTFTAGTILLDAAKIAAMDLTSSTMMPGDSVRSPVEVQNNGTAQLRYAVSQTSTNADTKSLRDQLYAVVRTADTGLGSYANDGDYCDDANGTSLHASAALGASGNLVGDPASGPNAGDRVLAASASEVLCFYVNLNMAAPNGTQGASTTTTFSFAAEQTANNP